MFQAVVEIFQKTADFADLYMQQNHKQIFKHAYDINRRLKDVYPEYVVDILSLLVPKINGVWGACSLCDGLPNAALKDINDAAVMKLLEKMKDSKILECF